MDVGWYNSLNKPSFTPPSWVFGPAWIILYILIGFSGYLVFRKGLKKNGASEALKFFSLQLVLNIMWSPIFFGAHQILLAFVDIVFLWYLIFKTIKLFSKIDRVAGYLLYPYLAWVSFAAFLNFSVLIMNK